MFLPNVLTDDVGIFKSFSPIFGYFKREDDRDAIIARVVIVLGIVSTIALCYLFWDYVYEGIDFILSTYRSIENWGYEKLENYHNRSSNSLSYTAKHDQYIKNIGDI